MLVAALSIAAVASPAHAVRRDQASPIAEYVRARAADAAGMPELAAVRYSAVLAVSPDDEVTASRAYRQAILAGDRALALKSARLLEQKGVLPPDARLLILSDAVIRKDWKAAKLLVDRIDEDDVFAFMAPAIGAWLAVGAGDSNPLAKLDKRRGGTLGAAYAGDQRALVLISIGKPQEALAAIRAQGLRGDGSSERLRVQAAASLLKLGRRADAEAMLAGDDPLLVSARERIAAGKELGGAVTTPAEGIAALLARVAVDVNRERVTPLALALARIATFLAPQQVEYRLVTAELLGGVGQYDAALAAIGEIANDSPLAQAARSARVGLLARKGEKDAALGEALAATKGSDASAGDWARVGDLYVELRRQLEAAAAFGRAIALAEADKRLQDQLWTLWLQRGGALEQAGDWKAGKAALEKALALAPEQPAVLNYLGYAQLERRQNLPEAEKLIAKASQLRPDDPAITDSLGWVYYLRGDVPKAIATLERAVAGEPSEPTINEHLGDAYWTAGRRYEARYAWQAALVYADKEDASRISRKLDTGLTPEVAAP
jgi:tetratricopeptide (TPR) repeat protein